jgi:sugar lactone lactonase YvrE
MSDAAQRGGAEEETERMANPKRSGALVLRLLVGLALLCWPRVGAAQGTWSVISLPQWVNSLPHKPGEVFSPTALAVDPAGNLYVADRGRIQKRDAQGNWSVIATSGAGLGQVIRPGALTVDAAGNLYVADSGSNEGRIQKRDPQGKWSVIATDGWEPGQVFTPSALAVDGAGNLYVADYSNYRIQKRDAQGNWSVIAPVGYDVGQVYDIRALAVDGAGNLYVADVPLFGDEYHDRIQKRDAQGNWYLIATRGAAPGQVSNPTDLAVDPAGNLYVAEAIDYWGYGNTRIQKRDVQGNWSLIASYDGQGLGQVTNPTALATDTAGNLYVVDIWRNGNYLHGQIQKRDVQGNWSVIAAADRDVGQVAVDGAGNLYIAETWRDDNYEVPPGQIRKRDAQGNWSVIATAGAGLGQVYNLTGLAVDAAGNLYVADTHNNRVQRFTPGS